MYFSQLFRVFLIASALHVAYGLETLLRKPYTLKVITTQPITGTVIPMGDLCLEPIRLAAEIANNRSDILPDYNLVFDIIDDECNGAVWVKRSVAPFLLNEERVFDGIDTPAHWAGQYQVPRQFNVLNDSARTMFVPPIFGGSLCSGVCSSVAQFMNQFNLVQVHT